MILLLLLGGPIAREREALGAEAAPPQLLLLPDIQAVDLLLLLVLALVLALVPAPVMALARVVARVLFLRPSQELLLPPRGVDLLLLSPALRSSDCQQKRRS